MKCCGDQPCNGSASDTDAAKFEAVKDYYGKVLQSTKDLSSTACTACGKPDPIIQQWLDKVPDEILDKFYGCGAPMPLGIDGLNVLDLGSGTGRDCYVCSALVGPHGTVVGVDMTSNQIEVAERHVAPFTKLLGYNKPNMRFIEGHMEYLDRVGIKDSSFDMIISNCVINLSPAKERVFKEAYRVLRSGGEMYFSDVYADRRLPEEAKHDEVLWGECLSGALYIQDFQRMVQDVGFAAPRVVSSSRISVAPHLEERLGGAAFYSITYHLFKIPGLLETTEEDYGHMAVYKGTIPGNPMRYTLDKDHTFEAGKPYPVSGNTAALLGEGGHSWLAKYFEVTGSRAKHYGLFQQ